MRRLIAENRLAVTVWAALVAATLVSWQLGVDGGGTGISIAAIAVIVIAFVKVRFVGRHFMELREAPRAMRLAVDAYVIGVGAALVVIYTVTS